MREKKVLEILSNVEDRYIEEANPLNCEKKNGFRKVWWIAVAASVCVLIMAGYGISLHTTKEPFVAFEIYIEEAILNIPYGSSIIYVFQKDIEEEYEYSFEAVLEYEDVYYKLSTDTNDETHIKELFDVIIGEQKNSVLGFTSYYVVAEETWKDFLNWKYYTETSGLETCIGEAFGYVIPKPEIYQNDFDGDGVAELVCNSMYGTGAKRVYIFRNNNGVMEVGYLCYDLYNKTMFPNITDMGAGYIQENYYPENGTFEVLYTTEDGMKSVILEGLDWVEFVPFYEGYF